MQVETTPTSMAIIKKITDVEKLEPSDISSEKVNGAAAVENCLAVLHKFKHRVTI